MTDWRNHWRAEARRHYRNALRWKWNPEMRACELRLALL